MSFLVELPERLYAPDAFAKFSAGLAFDRGTARAMAWMSQLAYESDDPGKIERICTLWNLHRPRVISNPRRLEWPLIQTRGIVAEGHGAIIFAFAGTDPLVLANWLTDFDVTVSAGNVHRGFANGVAAVWQQIVEALAGCGGQPVVITGHSLGAALAAVAADRALSDETVGVRATGVYAFGMPRAGGEDFARRYNDIFGPITYRFVHGEDIVATAPPRLGYRHVGRLIRCPRAGQFGDELPADFSDDPPFAASLMAGLQQGLRDLLKLQLQLQPTFRDDSLGRMSGLLPPPFADHLPDRYWHAFDGAK